MLGLIQLVNILHLYLQKQQSDFPALPCPSPQVDQEISALIQWHQNTQHC